MAEKRKVKRRKDEDFDFDNKKAKKPTKDEIDVAKWLKKNVPTKKTKFAGHNVEYFTGSKAVDALVNSEWSSRQESGSSLLSFESKKEDKEPFFKSRQDIVYFMNNMLHHNLFHRAKKVPVSEQELKAKMKKKEEKKKKEDEAYESSHAEGQTEERQKKCKKIKLEMHFDQTFVDNLDAYVWIFDPIPFYYWIIGFLLVIGAIAICLFPLWPPTVRMGVQYLSMGAAGLLILILALTVIRLIVFCLVWLLTCGTFHLWLLPNLTEDVGFFASFWPLYEYKYGKQIENAKNKKSKKKKAKDSDAEEETEKESKSKRKEEKKRADRADRFEANEEKDAENQNDSGDERDSQEEEDDDDRSDESERATESSVPNSPKKAKKDDGKKGGKKERLVRNDSEETDTESSSQHSQTGKDFEIIDKEDTEVKS